MILPPMNEVDLAELPPDVRKEMTFVPVRTLEEALAVSLPTLPKQRSATRCSPTRIEKAGADVTGATGATAARPRSIDACDSRFTFVVRSS